MTLETPDMDPTAYKTRVLHWIDVSTTVVFWIEALLKIVGFSFKLYFSYFTNKVGTLFAVVHQTTCDGGCGRTSMLAVRVQAHHRNLLVC